MVEPQQKRRSLGQRFFGQEIVDHGDLGPALPPARRDLAARGIGIDRVPGDPATLLEAEFGRSACWAGRRCGAAVEVILLLAGYPEGPIRS
jgi:hypothetical protein